MLCQNLFLVPQQHPGLIEAHCLKQLMRLRHYHFLLLNKKDKVLGVETFGESAPANIFLEHFGFTTPNVVEMAKSLVDE